MPFYETPSRAVAASRGGRRRQTKDTYRDSRTQSLILVQNVREPSGSLAIFSSIKEGSAFTSEISMQMYVLYVAAGRLAVGR